MLRDQRLDLVQRELLLDTMVQNTPVAMLLVAEHGPIVFANLAARQLLNQRPARSKAISLDDIAASDAPSSLREALDRGGDGLFTVARDGRITSEEDEIYHLARRSFTPERPPPRAAAAAPAHVELRRQEVQTWKKVIRVISHELNNSLAPVASLAHSGARAASPRPDRAAARHLRHHRRAHATTCKASSTATRRFAKLPTPRRRPIAWPRFVDGCASQIAFAVAGPLPDEPAQLRRRADRAGAVQPAQERARVGLGAGGRVRLRVRRIAGRGRDRGARIAAAA